MTNCPLCSPAGENVLLKNDLFRVIQVNDADYPGYFRVIANDHVKEMSELSPEAQMRIISALSRIEKIVLENMRPTKVNWAQLGNMVPHLHWHLIARYEDDAAFPDSIWSPRHRQTDTEVLAARKKLADFCAELIKDSSTEF